MEVEALELLHFSCFQDEVCALCSVLSLSDSLGGHCAYNTEITVQVSIAAVIPKSGQLIALLFAVGGRYLCTLNDGIGKQAGGEINTRDGQHAIT